MYGIFTYIYHEHEPNVGKYTIHASYHSPPSSCFHLLQRCCSNAPPEFPSHTMQDAYCRIGQLDLRQKSS